MKMCREHWIALRLGISDLDLDHLIPANGAAALRRMEDWMRNRTPASFDPLMSANNAIMGNAFERLGLEAMTKEDCPLCLIDEEIARPGEQGLDAKTWLRSAVNGSRTYAEENGLI